MVLAPILLLGAVEGGLRLIGTGYPVSFLLAHDASSWTSNPRFGWRFFPRELARSPVAFRVARSRPPGTLRVLVLGGSAAMGTPDSAYGLPRHLEARLASLLPEGRGVEVINAAMTAINSHVVREIVGDCMALAPDVVVVYMGNNEVVGPFGPGTIFHGLTRSTRLVRLSLWVKGLRLGQLIESALTRIGPSGPAAWRGMEMFVGHRTAADDPRLAGVYAAFEANLEAVLATAHRSGARVVLATVATNLTDCPPFGSEHRAGMTTAQLEEWQREVERGEALLSGGRADEAVTAFERAAAVDDRFAELRYRLAQALGAAGRQQEALEQFEAARDLDVLRFRADSNLNSVIREVARRWSDRGVRLADAERLVREAASGAGDEALFFEHVHFRFEGNLALAALLAPAVLEAAGVDPARRRSEPPTGQQLAERLGYSACEAFRVEREMHAMMMRPPFTQQLDHELRSARRASALADAWAVVAERRGACADWQEEAVERFPEDLDLRRKLAALLTRSGRPDRAVAHWRRLSDRLPEVAEWRTELGFALIDSGRKDEGLAEIRAVAATAPDRAGALANLGYVLRGTGDLAGAESAYREALGRNPRLGEAWAGLAAIELARGRRRQAREHYRVALERDPGFAEAASALGFLDQEDGRLEEAERGFRQAVAIAPQLAPAWNNLGHLLERQGRVDEAERCFRSALVADPTHALAAFNLGDLLLGSGRPAAAETAYRLGLLSEPDNHQGRLNLGLALRSAGRESEAAATMREVLARKPDSSEAMVALAGLLAGAVSDRLRDPAEALALSRRAEEVRGGEDWETLEVRAAALAAAGRAREARVALERALTAARDAGRRDAVDRLAERLGRRPEAGAQ